VVHVAVDDPEALADGIEKAEVLVWQDHVTSLTWAGIVELYESFFDQIGVPDNPHRGDAS